jgi:hypothetical protein
MEYDMNNQSRYYLAFILFFCLNLSAQTKNQVLVKDRYDTIIAKEHEVIEIANASVSIKWLRLADHSILRFNQSTSIRVENAFIGKSCVFDGTGFERVISKSDRAPGSAGLSGNKGFDLRIEITFLSLGQLLISTIGGEGTNGVSGAMGQPGQDGAIGGNDGENGQDGGRGGDGGDAGGINLNYKSLGFVVAINDNRRKVNVINLEFTGGKGGRGGQGGRGGRGGQPRDIGGSDQNGRAVTYSQGNQGRDGMPGKPGVSGREGKPGELRLNKIE